MINGAFTHFIQGQVTHDVLENLEWNVSNHTGTPEKLAGFDENGDATYYNNPDLNIDGGSAATVYTAPQVVDGGNA